jgi:octaprenyl-diphosphate synthase
MNDIKTADTVLLRSFAAQEAARLEKAMREDLAEALAGCDPFLAEVVEYGLFGGGKRIRPLLAILSARICGGDGTSVYRLAAALEYLHVATLIHDDVIDNAAERRGRDSVAHRYGSSAAILAGDWLHARSMHLVGRHAGIDGLEVFCRATGKMVDGEFLQLRYVADCSITEEQYFAIIHRKTAMLIASTCEIGAIFGGGSRVQRGALAEYGCKLGTAFQVVDDLLDYQGETARTGKQTGNDLAEGKLTLPFIRALANAHGRERDHLADLITGERGRENDLMAVSRLIEANEGFISARQTAKQLVREAVSALEVFTDDGDRESLDMLQALAVYVLGRSG